MLLYSSVIAVLLFRASDPIREHHAVCPENHTFVVSPKKYDYEIETPDR